jgi:hypothetical protein
MVDSSNPIDPFGHMKVEKTKAISDEEKKTFTPQNVDKKIFLYLVFLNFFLNTLNFFNKKRNFTSINQTPIHKELQTIKSSLESLKEKDLSQDPKFLNFFAYIWMKLFNDYKNYPISDEKTKNLLKDLISNINSYPKNSEFSLGYYISEMAGYKWVPFPYMDILRNLHIEYKKDPINSNLEQWIDLLNSLLEKI